MYDIIKHNKIHKLSLHVRFCLPKLPSIHLLKKTSGPTYLQHTTCSIFTGRYLDKISDVLLIKHLWWQSRDSVRGTSSSFTAWNPNDKWKCPGCVVLHHPLTMLISSLSFSSPLCLSLSLASASRPLRMGSSNLFLNSWAVPAINEMIQINKQRTNNRGKSNVLFGM